MGSSAVFSDLLSPESTVTSLLSSSGHLRSGLRDPERITTYTYRDKEYESASAALDAYISDFERSRVDTEQSVGRLVLPQSRTRLRNKDVLRERLTDVELNFLNLPVSSLRHRGNRDRLSMTTDELLSVPVDGSMPVTHTSAFIHGLMSQSGPSLGPGPRPGLGSSLNQGHPHPIRTLRTCRFRGSGPRPHVDLSSTVNRCGTSSRSEADLGHTLVPADVHTLPHRDSEWAEPESSTLHLPRWLTSNKAQVDCSEISSVPEVPYPAWIQHCDASETPSEPQQQDKPGVFPVGPQRTMSWVQDLEGGPEQEDGHLTLRDIRLQFAQQICVLAADRQSCDAVDALFRENRIQSLIQKADQVLDSLSQSSTGAPDGLQDPGPDGLQDLGPDGLQDPGPDGLQDPVSPVHTDDLLITNSSLSGSWKLSVDQRPPSVSSGLHGNQTQLGPVEALKQMLFRLQAVEAELQRRRPPPSQKQGSDLDGVTGGPSLQRALHHLRRLKLLVDESARKRTRDHLERDPDRDLERDLHLDQDQDLDPDRDLEQDLERDLDLDQDQDQDLVRSSSSSRLICSEQTMTG
uniref:Lung adenoma susceptibility protein 2 n=1 Tax=Sphaeramia orbicularis TaxID=375764 RepID=A0A672YU06_9TELE